MSYSGDVMDKWVDVEACMKFSFHFAPDRNALMTGACSTHEEACCRYLTCNWHSYLSKYGSLTSISCKRTSPLTCVLHILNVNMKSTFYCMYRPPISGSISSSMLWFVKKVSPQVVYGKCKVWWTIACSHFIKFNLHSMQLTFTH